MEDFAMLGFTAFSDIVISIRAAPGFPTIWHFDMSGLGQACAASF